MATREKKRAPGFKSIDWVVGFCREESREARPFSKITRANGIANEKRDGCGERGALGFEHADSGLVKDEGLTLCLSHHFLPSPRNGLDLPRKP